MKTTLTILTVLLALLFSGSAFAQSNQKLIPVTPEAEAAVIANTNNGKDYHDGLLKIYTVKVDAQSYAADDTYYLTKTAAQIETDLGYTGALHKVETLENGQRVASFTFSGMNFTDYSTIKMLFVNYGFQIVDISGELQFN